MDAVKVTSCVEAGIGCYEVVPGRLTAGELRRLVEKLVPVGDINYAAWESMIVE